MAPIIIRDAQGNTLATIERSVCRRFSMQAAQDHRKMDAFAAKHPAAHSATIGTLRFDFVRGRSELARGQI